MLALPNPESLVFSGEDERILNVTWSGFPDLQLTNDDSDTIIVGDASQSGL